MNRKKAQMQLGDAPMVVMIVGLVFLLMATFAFIGQKYGVALLPDATTNTITNESGAFINQNGYTLDGAAATGFANPSITSIYNNSDGTIILAGNYTLDTTTGIITNATSTTWADVNVTYTYDSATATAAYNVTGDLETEIGNNSSIAGIVLTISLIGIVLSVLIGVFISVRRRRI